MPRHTQGLRWAAAVRDSRPVSRALDILAMAYWRAFGKRDNDVFLCSYPKCGRTWLRFLLTYYQLRFLGVDYHLTLKTLSRISPNVTLFSAYRLRKPQVAIPLHRILGTHSDLPELFREQRLIVLRRDLRDVLVSLYHHRLARKEIGLGIESFLWSPWGLQHAIRYHNRWYRALSRFSEGSVLELTYEGIHADTAGSVRKCLRFMKVGICDSLVDETVSYSQFRNMRQLEERWGTPDFSAAQLRRDDNAFHVRKARVGSFREELSDEVVGRLDAKLRQKLLYYNEA